MGRGSFRLKGQICYSLDKDHIRTVKEGTVVCVDGISQGVFETVPKIYERLPKEDFGDCLIVPGLTDLHVHAPQYAFRGLGMDLELLEWLETKTFPEEAKYSDLDYAKRAYTLFAEELKRGGTASACVFATLHVPATELLMELLDEAGIRALVGKVNMDRNSPDVLREESAKRSEEDTLLWLKDTAGKYALVKPILTPRFIPTCSDELMDKLCAISEAYGLPLQSHLSENQGEIDWVKELCPDSLFYGDAYDKRGALRSPSRTVMAHCVWSGDEEIRLMKERGTFIAHCPQSNTNLSSGIAPVRRFIDEGISIGLGSDVAGGACTGIFRAMADAIQVSKLRWRLVDETQKPLTVEEAFYLGTLGGGAFFGNVGSFEEGYELDALVLNDGRCPHPLELSLKDRLERFIYLGDDRCIVGKYVAGRKIF